MNIEIPTLVCSDCGNRIKTSSNFCSNCGRTVQKELFAKEEISAFWIGGLYLFSMVVFLAFYGSRAYLWTFNERIVYELCVHGLDLVFFIFLFRQTFPLLDISKINAKTLLSMLFLGIGTSILVNFSIAYINILMGNEGAIGYYETYQEASNPILFTILFTAVMPAIFEEMAFRGFLFNALLKLVSRRTTIIISAFVFAMVHFSMISFYWLFPFGLLLGYLRYKYNTIWYGIALHFTHNFLVCCFEFYEYGVFSN